MVFRILKAKYFYRKDILQAYLEHKPSYLWRSLLAAKKLGNKGLAWAIWQNCNRAIFDKNKFDFLNVICQAERKWQEFLATGNRKITKEPRRKQLQKWKKPVRGKCKMNCDVAVGLNGQIGLGFVIRDENGEVQLARKEEGRADGGTTLLEGLAIRYGLTMSKQYHMPVN